MIVEAGTVAAQFLFWEYLFRIFDIGSLQCINLTSLFPLRSFLNLKSGGLSSLGGGGGGGRGQKSHFSKEGEQK
jgi:hypothetical protein